MDKLQEGLDEAIATKATLEISAKTAEDQVAELQQQVQALQAEAMEKRASTDKVAELEKEFKDMVACGGEMFVEGQNSVKKFIKCFPIENFSWIDEILPKKGMEEIEGAITMTLKNVMETREGGIEDPPTQYLYLYQTNVL